jgi:hypothetical protein
MVYTNCLMVYTIQKWYIPWGNLPDGPPAADPPAAGRRGAYAHDGPSRCDCYSLLPAATVTAGPGTTRTRRRWPTEATVTVTIAVQSSSFQ